MRTQGKDHVWATDKKTEARKLLQQDHKSPNLAGNH